MKKLKKPLIILFIVANLYAILCGGLYFFQDNLIFHPQQLPQDYYFDFEYPAEEVWLDAQDGARLHGLNFQVDEAKGTILYFHGNASSLARWGEIVQFFVKKQYNVVVMDYRQYGKSGGALTEQNLYDDSLLWYAFAKAQYSTTPIISYGRSLGTTFATYVAAKETVSQLVLETPFYSIENEASSRFSILPVKKLLNYEFPTYRFINDVASPITVLHGTEDEVVAYDHGKRLFDSIDQEEKALITIAEGGHNNLIEFPAYEEAIDKVLN
ncbi:alpha/beta hydrolase [Dokdonia sp. Dokd-P16]|uniref:alpha/beta hydrolase n=1 Tax=Dokdonia sp. Dokd-P16 TaxID=2173169 RepID=UPI000D548B10|nr:alpha/beta hydrolase [Dokdonia sp. Dokd-P16]AWH72632.1 alpha/beta hydrolase [Dokdonia sp. Dokd-P16]